MLLRSSSTPVLGSLLSETTPNSTPNHHEYNAKPTTNTKLISFHHSTTGFSARVSCNSPPISPSIGKCFRRAQSEGNLKELAYAPHSANNEDQFYDSYQPNDKYLTGRQRCLKLQTIPSFNNSRGYYEEDEEEEESDTEDYEDRAELYVNEELLDGDLRGGSDTVVALKDKVKRMNLTKVRDKEEIWNMGFAEANNMLVNQQMYLAKGFGIGGSGGGSGGGGDFYSAGSGGDDGDYKNGVEEYYKRMVEENPGNALFLRNYAQFLYQVPSLTTISSFE